jgi:hypothetical protein
MSSARRDLLLKLHIRREYGLKKSFDKWRRIVKLMQNQTDKKRPIKKETTMFSVSEKASEMIKEFLKNRSEAPSIRVLMQEGG